MDEIDVMPASYEDWAGLVRRAAEPDGHEARVTLEVHQRLLAVEARPPWVGIDVMPASHEDWAGLVRRAAEPDGHEARVTLEVHQRLLAVEARPPWVGTAADVAPQVVPATTADGLAPVEPATQAQQGVTVEELVVIMRLMPCISPGYTGEARWLLDHPRIGPLLRGEGVAKRVVLPEEPPINTWPSFTELAFMAYHDGWRDCWAAARAEVARQQGGQADE